MVTKQEEMLPVTSTIKQRIQNYGTLGKEMRLSPKSKIEVNHPGFRIEYNIDTVTMLVGIGKDHVAHLVMSRAAWEALKAGNKLDITTLKEFRKKFL